MDKNYIINESRIKLDGSWTQGMMGYAGVYALRFNAFLFLFLLIPWRNVATIYLLILTPLVLVQLLLASFLGGALNYGMVMYYSKVYKQKPVTGTEFAEGFGKGNLGRSFELAGLHNLLVFAWSLLLIVPGIIKAIEYSMAFIIARANTKLSPSEALSASRKLMRGRRKEYFKLMIGFAPHYLLCVLTLGLAYVWFAPLFNSVKMVYFKRVLQGDVNYIPGESRSAKSEDSSPDMTIAEIPTRDKAVDKAPEPSRDEQRHEQKALPVEEVELSFDEVFQKSQDDDFLNDDTSNLSFDFNTIEPETEVLPDVTFEPTEEEHHASQSDERIPLDNMAEQDDFAQMLLQLESIADSHEQAEAAPQATAPQAAAPQEPTQVETAKPESTEPKSASKRLEEIRARLKKDKEKQ